MNDRTAASATGFEGREDELGKAVALAIRTLKDGIPYQHEMNDALVKMHLNSLQFAKNKGLTAQFVARAVADRRSMLQRLRAQIEQTGDRTLAMQGVFDRSTELYQLCLDLEGSGGQRRFTFPFTHVLTISRRIGQFDLTDQEVHETWLRPCLEGYARELGVTFDVSDISADNKVTVTLL